MNHAEQSELVANLSRKFAEQYPQAERIMVEIECDYATVLVKFVVPYSKPERKIDAVG